MKVKIETTPKLRKIRIEIDEKDYTQELPTKVKQSICNYIQMKIIQVEDTKKDLVKDLPKSISINPEEYSQYCKKCPAFISNCAKYFKILHGKIEVCERLYKMIMDHYTLSNIETSGQEEDRIHDKK